MLPISWKGAGGGGKTLRDAEAIRDMAVIRRGVETEFFAEVRQGAYKDGDKWTGPL